MTKKLLPQWAEPHDARSHLNFAVSADFAERLRTAIEQAGLTPSDLARRIWGDAAPNAQGYVSAKNRDRISKYLAGKTIPDAGSLKLISEALNVPENQLAPQVVGTRLEREHPEMRMTVIAGHHDKVHLTINTVIDVTCALQIIAIVRDAKTSRAPTALELRERDKPFDETGVLLMQHATTTPVFEPKLSSTGSASVADATMDRHYVKPDSTPKRLTRKNQDSVSAGHG